MTGTDNAGSRGRLVSAGYAHRQGKPAKNGRELYIADDPGRFRKGKPARFEQAGLSRRPWRDTLTRRSKRPEAERRTPHDARARDAPDVDYHLKWRFGGSRGVAACVLLGADDGGDGRGVDATWLTA